MYQFDMTDDEVKEAKWASKEVGKHLDGSGCSTACGSEPCCCRGVTQP